MTLFYTANALVTDDLTIRSPESFGLNPVRVNKQVGGEVVDLRATRKSTDCP